MFINYLTLMLANLVAGLFLVAHYVYWGLDRPDQRPWVPGFAMVGLVALLTGLNMIWHWPLPSSYNIAFGEMSVLFGTIFLGAALALAWGWPLLTVGLYALFAGLAAVVVGVRIIALGMTQEPLIAGTGFILAGLGGVLCPVGLHLKANRTIRLIISLILLAAALVFAVTGYVAYWGHLSDYAAWTPATVS